MTGLAGSGEGEFDWSAHRVLVTGATGLLGAWVTSELQAAGADVVVIVRDAVPRAHLWSNADVERLTVAHGELEDYPFVERVVNEYEVDSVFHLAAQTIVTIANRSPLSTFEANIRGTYHVLEACRAQPRIRSVVVASSDKAYGDQQDLPYTEDAPLLARHPYDVSKACADMLALTYANTYGVPVCVTRCGNLFGPGDLNWNRLIPGTVRSALRGERPVIRSDGSLIRDYFYVRDGALAYLHLAEFMQKSGLSGEAFNFSNEIQLTVLDVVDRVLAALGSELRPIIQDDAKGEIQHQYLSTKKAHEWLGWKPVYTLDQGLRESIVWYQQFLGPSPAPEVA